MKGDLLADLLTELDIDQRHDLLEVAEADGILTGTAELRFLEQVTEFCEAQELLNAVVFVAPQAAVMARQTFLRTFASDSAPHATEALAGDEVEILGSPVAGQVRVRMKSDRYLGFVKQEAVISAAYPATHTVTGLRAHLYAGPRVQAPIVSRVSWGTQLRIRDTVGAWSHVILPDGQDAFIHSNLLAPGTPAGQRDVVETARRFLGVPYVWGGNTAWGLDCSGLVQLVWRMADVDLPRDADEQFAAGLRVDLAEAEPGDAICYRGHIGIYLGAGRMIHAAGSAMLVREDNVFATDLLRESFLGVTRFQLPSV